MFEIYPKKKKKNQYVPINLSVSEYKPCAVHKGNDRKKKKTVRS